MLDHAYPMPSRTDMRNHIDFLVTEMKARIESFGASKENKFLH